MPLAFVATAVGDAPADGVAEGAGVADADALAPGVGLGVAPLLGVADGEADIVAPGAPGPSGALPTVAPPLQAASAKVSEENANGTKRENGKRT